MVREKRRVPSGRVQLYFSGGSNRSHQRSAKELISRYESLKAPDASRKSRAALDADLVCRVKQGSVLSLQKTAPFRQSFRNLLTVFKKGKRDGEEKVLFPHIPFAAYKPSRDAVHGMQGSGRCIDIGETCPTVSGNHFGPLLYLDPSPISSTSALRTLPVWATCIATLKTDHILLTSVTAQGNPSTRTVSLASLADVRSLASDEIGHEIKALLPTEGPGEQLRIFEISFEGRAHELFAARSAQERAGWVSAIW